MTRRLLQSAGLDQLRDLARSASVTQLRRVLSSYSFDTPPSPEGERPEEHHRVSFGYTEEGSWSISALLPSDEGALWERALAVARERAVPSRPG